MNELEKELSNIVINKNLYSVAIVRKLCDKILDEEDASGLLKIDLDFLKRLRANDRNV